LAKRGGSGKKRGGLTSQVSVRGTGEKWGLEITGKKRARRGKV